MPEQYPIIDRAIRRHGQVFTVCTFGSPGGAGPHLIRQMLADGRAVEDGGVVVFTDPDAAGEYADGVKGTGSVQAHAYVCTCWSVEGVMESDVSAMAGRGWKRGVHVGEGGAS